MVPPVSLVPPEPLLRVFVVVPAPQYNRVAIEVGSLGDRFVDGIRGWWRPLFEGVVVDGVDAVVIRRSAEGRVCGKVWRIPATAAVILPATC